MADVNKIWKEALLNIEANPDIPTVSYDVWIKNLEPYCIDSGEFVLVASSTMTKNIATDNYLAKIYEALKVVYPMVLGAVIITEDEKEKYKSSVSVQQGKEQETAQPGGLNIVSRFTFDNYVVGPSNQFVYAAARAVAENPGNKYNPLFIYGGVGLGKTHLMHAIGNYVKQEKPNYRVLYVSADYFVNELVDTIRNSQDREHNKAFREKYRNADVLMIDDVQGIVGKSGTQEAMFHIFNDLFQNGKQIIMTSDRPPKEFDKIEERLKTRFEWGLIADISAPDIETRIAILQKKAEQDDNYVPGDVLRFIASKVESNIREMEGLYLKVVFYSELIGKDISMETAREALKDYIDESTYTVDVDAIIDTTCDFFRVKREDLCGKSRAKEIAEPRMICMYLICDMLDLPLTAIGEAIGGRDHTTVIHARDKIENLVKKDERKKIQVKDLKDRILKR
ncbi:MAG: chromosomal replication initiator protein DnaA [Clostridia bacterium]|nr:chromosomal replication initiator protein DnaA [Clostridia bacterium]